MDDCCTTGSLWQSGTPTGETTVFPLPGHPEGIKIYKTKSARGNKNVVLMIPGILTIPPYIYSDIFGPFSPNIQLLADKLSILMPDADIIIPDILDGDYLPVSLLSALAVKPKTFWETYIVPLMTIVWGLPTLAPWQYRRDHVKTLKLVEAIVAEVKGKYAGSMYSVGFCFGGRYSAIIGGMDGISAIAAAHPSDLKAPVSISPYNRH
jgi:hypothetical protein